MVSEEQVYQQVEALLSRMSLEQKIGQMTQPERMAITPEEVKAYHIGSVLSGGGSAPGQNRPEDWMEMNDAYWAASMFEDTDHLAIPLIYGVDAIHGHNNVLGATIFPHNIGLGAAHDTELMERIGAATAREILCTGVEWTFAPTLAVAQNYEWGRTYESYSSDPQIVAEMGKHFLLGLQGGMPRDGVLACVKHWVGDGGTTDGVDQGNTAISESELRSKHIPPYIAAINAGALSVMASFNSWNGKKCHGHQYLLTEVLKNELGFRGFIISDWDGIDYLSENPRQNVIDAVNAGLDMFMVSVAWRDFIANLIDATHAGDVPMSRIDDAVGRILFVKLKMGLFEAPRPKERYWSKSPAFGITAHRQLAREAVRKSLVLLKNEDAILPLKKEMRILVAGKNAHDTGHQCGGFTIAWQGLSGAGALAYAGLSANIYGTNAALQKGAVPGATSIWEGISGESTNAVLSLDGSAVERESFDVAVVVIGETPYAEGMGDVRADSEVIDRSRAQIYGLLKVLNAYGRSLHLSDLHPEDLALLERIAAKNIPIVAVFVSGRPLFCDPEMALSQAFVAAWLPGSEGAGVADALFGNSPFQGRLSFDWPEPQSSESKAKYSFQKGYGLGAKI